jgi:hypothetical protein
MLAAANLSIELQSLTSLRQLQVTEVNNPSLLARVLPTWINKLGTLNKLSMILPGKAETTLIVNRISKALGVPSKFNYSCPMPVELNKDKGFHCIGRGSSSDIQRPEVCTNKYRCFINGVPIGMHIWKADQGKILCWEVLDGDGKGVENDTKKAA